MATGKGGRATKTSFLLVLGVWKIHTVQGCYEPVRETSAFSLSLFLPLWLTGGHGMYRATQKMGTLEKKPTKIEEIQEKKLLTEIEPLQLAF